MNPILFFTILGLIPLLAGCFDKTESPVETEKTRQHGTALSSQATPAAPETLGAYDYAMRKDPIGQNKTAAVDYYTLVLSWSPAFCTEQRQKHGDDLPASARYQCGMKKKYGWIIHGLWPQSARARSAAGHPRFCRGDLPAVDAQVIRQYLNDSPSPSLLQAEWEKHGACAFDSAQAYFQKQQALFQALNLPAQEMKKKDLFRWMRKHNPQLNGVYLGASKNELYICYDLQWKPIDCEK
ncbi:ribonuclease [Pasteurellaceae bacterium LIM206]|nr:ribonuclease [Pasteurellaceae bacterium LIM206]